MTLTVAPPTAAATARAPQPREGLPAATPYLELDVGVAVARYQELAAALPGTGIRYAVKANPHPALLRALATAGCSFDVASPAEVHAALAAGAAAGALVCSNPVRRRDHAAEVAGLGVRVVVVDSPQEVAKVAEVAPGSSVLVRILASGDGSDWPLSRKYGCSPSQAVRLLHDAAVLGLDPAGVCFHVGSQQRDPRAWCTPVADAARVFTGARTLGLRPWLLDLGGGFPARLEGQAPPVTAYGRVIEEALDAGFGGDRPHTLAEPGRGIVGDAGTVVARVVAVLDRGVTRWVYLDAGVFTGLVETLDEAIRYRLETSADGGPTRPCVLAGPTCDSADVLYERRPVHLPRALAEGDVVRLRSAGAYTTCYSTVGFNGFAPMSTVLTGT
ncbi:MAG TPA: type III PLP-dependent enzyme [Dermatophilaceae bacterium]|nr:type III PLP-dependent enzyme [Dermatophilaceae bacterium]